MDMMIQWFQIVLYIALLLLLVKPLGAFMARVYTGERTLLSPILGPLERLLYRLAGIDANAEMNWRTYAAALLIFSGLGMLVLYLLQRAQGWLPLNPAQLGSVDPWVAFNTAASFTSNTNWQFYGGETTLSYLTQMAGLTVQNFISAAMGMAVLIALIRGIGRQTTQTIGNFWVGSDPQHVLHFAAALADPGVGAGFAGRGSNLCTLSDGNDGATDHRRGRQRRHRTGVGPGTGSLADRH